MWYTGNVLKPKAKIINAQTMLVKITADYKLGCHYIALHCIVSYCIVFCCTK